MVRLALDADIIPFAALTCDRRCAHGCLTRPLGGLSMDGAGEAAPRRAAGLGSCGRRCSAHVWYGSAAGAGPGTDGAPSWTSMLLWVPLFEPPSSAWGTAWTGSLWFVPAYLWLTLISPPLLWCFRRWPLRTAVLPVLGLALALSGVWSPSSPLGEVLLTFALFGGYWLIGFAYHENRIQAMSWISVIIVSLILASAGLIGTLRAGDVTAAQLAGLPVANSLWGAGVVILLLRLYRNPNARPRSAGVRTALAAVQDRALTIFLWSFPAFSISAALLAGSGFSPQSTAAAITQRTVVAVG